MKTVSTAHLTDDQFTECVTLHPNAESEAHLAECGLCREELKTFSASLKAFDTASMAWSAARPQPHLRIIAASKARRAVLTPVAWALAAAALIVAGTPLWQHAHPASRGGETAVVAAPEDSEAQIAQDNRLLESVNMALAAPDPSPFNEYRLRETSQTQVKPRMELRNP